jgi:hypothetical protein
VKNFKTVLLILAVCAVGFLLLRRSAAPQEKAASATVASGLFPAGTEACLSKSIPLIRGGEAADIPWTSRTPAAKRVRKIFPDLTWMTPEPVLKAGDHIELALFDDAIFEAEISNVTRYPNGGVGVTARLDGQNGTAYLACCDGTFRALVEVYGGADYAVRYNPEKKTHYAIEIDSENTLVLEGADPAVPDAAADISSGTDIAVAGGIANVPSGSTIIDVMIVYTPAALAFEGSDANMKNNINLAMQQANNAHSNSDTRVYLNLVHSEEVNYTEVDYSADLNNLTYSNGSYSAMDEVHTLRAQYSADLVCLFKTDPTYGGYGWVLNNTNGNSSSAFCWVNIWQSDRLYTTVHEWGHNMGCGHSKNQTLQPGPGLYSYSAGWQWDEKPTPPYGHCTVMTYEDVNGDKSQDYIRAPYFSNPSILYPATGDATGDAADGDNARTIRNMKTVLANYRKAPDLDYDGLPNEWELQYFGGETNANPNAFASNGVNTVLEAYIAGLNPTNRFSFFKVDTLEPPETTNGGFVIRWSAVTGRVYGVYRATNLLMNSFQPLATNMVWPQASYTDTVHRTEFSSFYQINVRLP